MRLGALHKNLKSQRTIELFKERGLTFIYVTVTLSQGRESLLLY